MIAKISPNVGKAEHAITIYFSNFVNVLCSCITLNTINNTHNNIMINNNMLYMIFDTVLTPL